MVAVVFEKIVHLKRISKVYFKLLGQSISYKFYLPFHVWRFTFHVPPNNQTNYLTGSN